MAEMEEIDPAGPEACAEAAGLEKKKKKIQKSSCCSGFINQEVVEKVALK